APTLCLASMSPRRRELLQQIGVRPLVTAPNIDEAVLPGEAAADYVVRMARTKALSIEQHTVGLPVLAADTVVLIDELILGKPASAAEGVAMLERLAGRAHEVLTAVALAANDGLAFRLSASEVRFRALTRAECRAYWDTGEPHDKAGGYAVQGRGAVFIESLNGSYSGVMGLPLYETAELLRAAGVPYWLGGAPRERLP
ncbi:MAG TPA: nucleoside triphosphate pyrophosphatase, partial [Steroidobacteraceae bacterium]|nr:nucleoside triphosphate pyrophosphatase [Steroidobacteraceae bacterium]